jgi:SAM-dependent methyltransferase
VSGSWFGELYFESTADLLTPRLSSIEAAVVTRLLRLRPGARVLDIACGHGRHLSALEGNGLALFGVDLDGDALGRAAGRPPAPGAAPLEGARRPAAALVRADQLRLPFRSAFDAAYSWYSSLFLYDEAGNERALAEAARVLAPGGRLLVQHANPLRLSREPEARAARELPGGGRVEESSRFDAALGVETLSRVLVRGGRVLAGATRLRYYNPSEWERIAARAGLRVRELASTGGGDPEPFSEHSLDLIAVLEKPT